MATFWGIFTIPKMLPYKKRINNAWRLFRGFRMAFRNTSLILMSVYWTYQFRRRQFAVRFQMGARNTWRCKCIFMLLSINNIPTYILYSRWEYTLFACVSLPQLYTSGCVCVCVYKTNSTCVSCLFRKKTGIVPDGSFH